jgi:hypothetical protein
MEGVFFTEPVGRRVAFRDPGRTGTVDLDVDEVRVLKETGSGHASVVVRTRTDYFTYARIREQEWFRLTRDSIDPDIEGFQFWSHAPVEVDLRLDRLPETLVGATPGEVAEKVAAGLASDTPDPALCDASAYRYLTVLQDLEGNGVRKGFQAVWAR